MKVITTGLLNRFWTKGIKPWLDKRIKSYADLMVTTASGYTPDALAVKEGFTELNGKLEFMSDTNFKINIENDTLCIRCYKNNNHFYELEADANQISLYSVIGTEWTKLWQIDK